MVVLVTAASRHGATREIAARIARVLDEDGVSAELVEIGDVGRLERYDGVVLGSAVYLGQWLPEARTFVDRHAEELSRRPTWLFSSGPIVGDPPMAAPEDERAGRRVLEAVGARDHVVFAGKLAKSGLGLLERVAVRAAHAAAGDHRDWEAIDRWASEIAADLEGRPATNE